VYAGVPKTETPAEIIGLNAGIVKIVYDIPIEPLYPPEPELPLPPV
jgi:hypothetical protein